MDQVQMDSNIRWVPFIFLFEKAQKKRLTISLLLSMLIVSALAALLIWQWQSRISLGQHWWYTTEVRIEIGGNSREQTFQLLGSRVNRGIFSVETYTIQEWDEAKWAWVPSKIPAGSTVEIVSRLILDRRGVQSDIEGTHLEDRHRFIGSVTIRRDLLWVTVGVGCATSVCLSILIRRIQRRLRRFNLGLCPSCAYPLLPGLLVTCPECGQRVLQDEQGHEESPSQGGS